jgi:hypothetical protein
MQYGGRCQGECFKRSGCFWKLNLNHINICLNMQQGRAQGGGLKAIGTGFHISAIVAKGIPFPAAAAQVSQPGLDKTPYIAAYYHFTIQQRW